MTCARRHFRSCVHASALAAALTLVASTAAAQRRTATVRRGAPGVEVKPTADASVTFGSVTYSGSVDANCSRDERARAGTGRAYFHIMYPWFGARPAIGQPAWRFELNVMRPARPGAYDQFMFHFQDGAKSGTIQKVPGSARMGSGTVRVTTHGAGARFDVEGRSQNGEAIRATIDCVAFPRSEAAGG